MANSSTILSSLAHAAQAACAGGIAMLPADGGETLWAAEGVVRPAGARVPEHPQGIVRAACRPLMRAAVTPLIQRFRGGSSSGRATGVKTNY
jgi:hypothetical protein